MRIACPATARLVGLMLATCVAAPLCAQISVDHPVPQTATIAVDVAHPSPDPIPNTIFGTFLEPIGNSTYNGLWAELLENPSFEAGLWSASNVRSRLARQPELARASELGLPLPWEPLDAQLGNRYEIRYGSGNAANSNASLEVIGVPGRSTGIRQRVYLPAHRTLEYQGSLFAKHLSGPSSISITLRKRNSAQVLATTAINAAAAEWTRYPFTLTLARGAVAKLEPSDFVIEVAGDEAVLLDEISLMPADALRDYGGLDPEMIARVRDLHTPLIRFGGNFTSGYHWRDGIGPQDKRVSMLNVAWGIPEYNTFGTDEFLHFCELVHAQPQIAVNLGSGTPQEAAEWVEYVNTRWRTIHPGASLTWELGNELWGSWNTGWPTLEQLAPRTAAYAEAIHHVDPEARLIATGQDPDVYQKWNATQLSNPPGTMQFLSTHFVVTTDELEAKTATDDFRVQAALAMPVELERRFHAMQQQIDSTPHRDRVHIAFTEWLWVGKHYDFEAQTNQGENTVLFDNFAGALATGGVLNMLLRSTHDVPISDMTGVIEFAGVWKRRGQVYATPAASVFRMFAESEPDRLLPVTAVSGDYSVHHGITRLPEISAVPYLDVTSAIARDGRHILLFVINRSLDRDIASTITLRGARLAAAAGTATTLTSSDLFARNSEEHPDAVITREQPFQAGSQFSYTFPRASITRLALARQ